MARAVAAYGLSNAPSRRARPSNRLYNCQRWRSARAGWLRHHPLCVLCERRGEATAATVVDHIRLHRGDVVLFWDRDNWQSLCKHCHDSVKQAEERNGYARGCGVDGLPLDPRHPWGTGA